MDTLALTLAAVLVSLLIGIPLGVWAGLSHRVERTITPGPRLHADDADVRLPRAAHPVLPHRPGVGDDRDPHLRDAAGRADHRARDPLGTADDRRGRRVAGLHARRRRCTKVLLPMSRRTIVLGINQTIMAALSMVTIAALIDAPGLGKTVIKALQTLDVGTAFNAGLAIVVLAIILDRVTTAAAERADATHAPSPQEHRRRQIMLAVGGVVTVVCVYLSYTYVWASTFPEHRHRRR